MNNEILSVLARPHGFSTFGGMGTQLGLEKSARFMNPRVLAGGTLGAGLLGAIMYHHHMNEAKDLLREAGGPQATEADINKLLGNSKVRLNTSGRGISTRFSPHVFRRGVGTLSVDPDDVTLAEVLPSVAEAQLTKNTVGRRLLRALSGLGAVHLGLSTLGGLPSPVGVLTVGAHTLHNMSKERKALRKAQMVLDKLPMSDEAKKQVKRGWEERRKALEAKNMALLGIAGLHGLATAGAAAELGRMFW